MVYLTDALQFPEATIIYRAEVVSWCGQVLGGGFWEFIQITYCIALPRGRFYVVYYSIRMQDAIRECVIQDAIRECVIQDA
jgi:hypothetical protein